MLNKQAPTEDDVQNAVIFSINFFHFIVFYILGNIAFWIIWDSYLANTSAISLFGLWLLYGLFGLCCSLAKFKKIILISIYLWR